ncbi:divalent-cation tolerance protein CutA [Candidatus Micrarchaeota archaeon]|nr:divalent-cation tolerance protein CutA [Candidatus Micrarchaeota archaeon]
MLLVYVTCSNDKEAEKIARLVVKDKLAACALVLPPAKSFFYWKKTMQETTESVLLLKVKNSGYSKLEKKILQLHSYETPCIIALKPSKVFKKYDSWVSKT